MSLDLYMVIKSCEHCGHVETTDSLNITYNLAPMWKDIFPNSIDMCDIDEMTGKNSEKILRGALKALIKNPRIFIAMEAPNGWGRYEDFVRYIEKLIELCDKHPDGIWHSDR